ncbi:MAG TPA: hypothetical protein VFA07_13655 [Chthonomonadaceae bacterium]|nr:hypothetical protein [Chthonomonadaceae bacterium]
MLAVWTAWLVFVLASGPAQLPQTVWLEAETFGPLRGANFSYMPEAQETRGAWSLAGPDVAASWTQGGESEFLSIAARADAPAGLTVGRDTEIAAAGSYTLWVRYADYRKKEEAFGVRIVQGSKTFTHVFGQKAVVDELDPMKLRWGWAYGWDSAPVTLEKGKARIELFTTGPTGARRCVDCLCLTTDPSYHPAGREKPDFAFLLPLRAMRQAQMPPAEPLVAAKPIGDVPKAWKIASGPPVFLWNVGTQWLEELKKPAAERIDTPFDVDPPLLKEFTDAYRGKPVPIFGHPLSGPVWHIPLYPQIFASGSPFLDWLERHPQQKFAILWNYGEPSWPSGADHAAVAANLRRYTDRFMGFIAGEALSYAPVDTAVQEQKVRAARSRAEVLSALRDLNTAATNARLAGYFGAPVATGETWHPVISCLSANNEAFAHALHAWGMRIVGHENTGNSPTLSRRLAFLRGAARQFGGQIVDYQSCNLGDASTIFSRESSFYPASSRYILDNSYDAFAGAGLNWVLKDYLLYFLAGASAFYHEEGTDLFWKPGGNSAGDSFPVQLSPRGAVTEAFLDLAAAHPRGTQVTPVAFLLDEAHGWAQERFSPGAFGLDPQLNPAVLTPGRHEAALRGWFDIATYPAPETLNEPASAIRQTYVNGIFGDIFDVLVTAPGHAEIVSSYPVIIAAGEIALSEEWGRALREYVRRGGTLVVAAEQLTGPGVVALGLPAFGAEQEASAFVWKPTGETVPANVFRTYALPAGPDRVLATAPDGTPITTLHMEGRGQIISIGVPLGLGIDERPVPLMSLLMRSLTEGLVPVRVTGDVEWVLNRLDDGGWLVTLLNNRGILKPEHGILPTDYHQAMSVTLQVPFTVRDSAEWVTETPVSWQPESHGAVTTLTVPAGAVRMIVLHPSR